MGRPMRCISGREKAAYTAAIMLFVHGVYAVCQVGFKVFVKKGIIKGMINACREMSALYCHEINILRLYNQTTVNNLGGSKTGMGCGPVFVVKKTAPRFLEAGTNSLPISQERGLTAKAPGKRVGAFFCLPFSMLL